jgi:putative DNA primase/helicase
MKRSTTPAVITKSKDSVQLFISECDYKKSAKEHILISVLFPQYKSFCIEDGYRAVGKQNLYND